MCPGPRSNTLFLILMTENVSVGGRKSKKRVTDNGLAYGKVCFFIDLLTKIG